MCIAKVGAAKVVLTFFMNIKLNQKTTILYQI